MILIASSDIVKDVNDMINCALTSGYTKLRALKSACTVLQHIDWALNITGNSKDVYDLSTFSSVDLSKVKTMFIVGHGSPKSIGSGTGVDQLSTIANLKNLASYTGTIYITACFSSEPKTGGAVVAEIQKKVKSATIVGYPEETVTHKVFGNAIYIVKNHSAWTIAEGHMLTNPMIQLLLSNWGSGISGSFTISKTTTNYNGFKTPKKIGDVLTEAANVSSITGAIYTELITKNASYFDKQTITWV